MDYLLVCRSITYAQRMAAVLHSAGISAAVVRTPVGAAQESCGYSVRIGEKQWKNVQRTLKNAELWPKKLLRQTSHGAWEEVRP